MTNCSTNYKFAGYEQDSETGLYYAMARYYNPRLGRFMSPDPLMGDIRNPQTLNRYAYVANNPLNFSDPRGMDEVSAPPETSCTVDGAQFFGGACVASRCQPRATDGDGWAVRGWGVCQSRLPALPITRFESFDMSRR